MVAVGRDGEKGVGSRAIWARRGDARRNGRIKGREASGVRAVQMSRDCRARFDDVKGWQVKVRRAQDGAFDPSWMGVF
jgi:hypothetical protein